MTPREVNDAGQCVKQVAETSPARDCRRRNRRSRYQLRKYSDPAFVQSMRLQLRFEVIRRISSDRHAPDCNLSHCAGHLALGFPIRIRSPVGIAQVTTINPLS